MLAETQLIICHAAAEPWAVAVGLTGAAEMVEGAGTGLPTITGQSRDKKGQKGIVLQTDSCTVTETKVSMKAIR